MATMKPESRMLEEVRCWRREAYEARRAMTPEQLAAQNQRNASELGLRSVRPKDLVKPNRDHTRNSG
jgi:hypothetical protein